MTLRSRFVSHLLFVASLIIVTSCAQLPASAQDSKSQAQGAPDDWSHHHMVFSDPSTREDAIRNGTYEHWLRVQTDPRFKMQQMKRQTVQLPQSDRREPTDLLERRLRGRLQRDWNVSLGAGGVAATMYPAKYSFDINNASCSDFVVFPANTPGAAAVAASQTGTFTGNPTNGQTATIGGTEVLTASLSTPETATITLSTTVPADTSSVTIGSVTYTFRNTATITTPGANACNIRSESGTDSGTQVATNLNNAINNTGGSNTTWRCGTGAAPNSAATSTRATRTLSLTATVWGTAGNFTFSQSGTTNFTIFTSTAGTDGTNTGTSFRIDNVVNDNATNLAAAITRNGGTVGVTATSTGAQVTVTATTPGTSGNSITVAENMTNFSWTSGTLAGGANGQANLVGINNLYSGSGGFCGAAPTVKFSYQVGAGTLQTSPSLSTDGTKVAYVESISGGSKFHVLKIGTSGSNGSSAILPATPGTGNNAADTAITMNGSVQVTLSSAYIDYQGDIAYVGDDSGRLHKFTGVFNGTPAEVTSAPWPVTVSSGNVLTGPIWDQTSGNIFVGDGVGVLRYVKASTGVVGATSINVGAVNGYATPSGRPLIDPAIVDPSIGKVYAFIGCGLSATNNSACTSSDTSPFSFAQVMQASTSLTGPIWAPVGFASGSNNTHIGAFDNTYYTGSIASGHLYVCGQPSLLDPATLYQIGFNASGNMTTASATTRTLSTTTDGTAHECSPLTEIYNSNTSTDWLFLSVSEGCNASGGGAVGCAMNFNITSGFPPAGVGFAQSTGTSAIVIDNISSMGQASSLYYGTLPSGANTCVKLTQANLN